MNCASIDVGFSQRVKDQQKCSFSQIKPFKHLRLKAEIKYIDSDNLICTRAKLCVSPIMIIYLNADIIKTQIKTPLMTTRRKSIAVDMDNVIADIEEQIINWYERDFGLRVTREAMHGIPEEDAFPDKQAVTGYINKPGFFRTLPLMPGAVEALKRLMVNFDVYIVSAAMEFPLSLYEKHQWLLEHFPFISWRNIVFCGDKSLIHTDYMIDDHPKNLDFCKGKPIMFTASHNRNHSKYTRVNNWDEAIALLEKELESV